MRSSRSKDFPWTPTALCRVGVEDPATDAQQRPGLLRVEALRLGEGVEVVVVLDDLPLLRVQRLGGVERRPQLLSHLGRVVDIMQLLDRRDIEAAVWNLSSFSTAACLRAGPRACAPGRAAGGHCRSCAPCWLSIMLWRLGAASRRRRRGHCVLPRAVMSACPSFYYCQRLGAEVCSWWWAAARPEPELLDLSLNRGSGRVGEPRRN